MQKYILLFMILIWNISCAEPPYGGPAPPILIQAVEKDNIEEVKSLLEEEKEDVNVTDIGEHTALFYVKSVEMAEYLISKGANINARNESQKTPLHTASNIAVAEFFLQNGLDIEAQTRDGDEWSATPLYYAVFDERYNVANFLFKKGANPNAGNIKRPLDEAKSKSSWYTFRLNRLIKEFESYTSPETNQPEAKKESSKRTDEP